MPSRNKNFIILPKSGSGPTGPVPTALYTRNLTIPIKKQKAWFRRLLHHLASKQWSTPLNPREGNMNKNVPSQ